MILDIPDPAPVWSFDRSFVTINTTPPRDPEPRDEDDEDEERDDDREPPVVREPDE
jgi:hypothetical protein